MPTIDKLNAADSLTSADQIPIYSAANGDARKISASKLAEFVRSTITTADDKVTQYAAPNATGQTIQVADGPDSVWLVVSPASTYATGILKLPAVANCVDRQEIMANYSGNGVTALTVDGNGATGVIGAPSSVAAGGFFRLRFDGVTKTWYRVG